MSNETEKRQEVTVTDIQMRFGSMVLFMVKWVLASIPAFVILIVLGTGLLVALSAFLGLGAFFPSHSSRQAVAASSITAASSPNPEPPATNSEAAAYFSKILVRKVSVGQSVLGETGVFGEVKNTGDRTLETLEITVYCLGADGKPVFEKTYDPVLVSDVNFNEDSNQPLKPGYSRQFGVKMDDAPSDWAKKVDVKVTRVEFQ